MSKGSGGSSLEVIEVSDPADGVDGIGVHKGERNGLLLWKARIGGSVG